MKYTEFNPRSCEVHQMVLEKIGREKYVLELGCATGYFTKELNKKDCKVMGIEYEKEAAEIAKKYCERVIVGDLEDPNSIKIDKKSFDVVLLMDVIEHIRNRELLLQAIHHWVKPDGFFCLTTPNIAHISIRLKLLGGDFTYTDKGILDITHVHFFTKKTLCKSLRDSGFKIVSIEGSTDFGQIPFLGRFLRHIPKVIQNAVTKLWPTLLSVQWVVVAKIA